MATMEVDLGESGIVHAFQTPRGVMFSMSEIASKIFLENPTAFAKELRQGRYNKQHTEDKTVLEALAHLNVFPESASTTATLLSPRTLEELLNDKRKVCLSLGRSTQCQELLGIAAWLFLQGPESEENHETQAEISRLFGQLYVLQNKPENALKAFAEEVYYVSKQHGVLDIRTSIGFYNTFKVLKNLGRFDDCLAFGDVVVEIWLLVMGGLVLNGTQLFSKCFGDLDTTMTPDLTNSQENLQWVHINDIVAMLQDILGVREQVHGLSKANADEIFLAIGLIYLYKKDFNLALESLNEAKKANSKDINSAIYDIVESALSMIEKPQSRG